VFAGAFQPVPQPRLKPINRFVSDDALDLSTNKPPVHAEWPARPQVVHRGIVMLGQLDVGVQYQSVGESPELSYRPARIIGSTGSSPHVVTSTSMTGGNSVL